MSWLIFLVLVPVGVPLQSDFVLDRLSASQKTLQIVLPTWFIG